MLTYNNKEAKRVRVDIRKMADQLRGPVRVANYPDRDVKETLTDLYEWSKKADSLPQVLRRAYDLHWYIKFNLEDHWDDNNPFTLTEELLNLAYDIEALCAKCRRVCTAGGVSPDDAYQLHDGSNCPLRDSRKKGTTRRSDNRFNRDLAKKEDVKTFAKQQLQKGYEAYKKATETDEAPTITIKDENKAIMDAIVEVLSVRVREDNFTLSPDNCRGGNIVIIKKNGGYYPRAYEKFYVPKTKFEIAGIIYLKRPLVYTDESQFFCGESYLDVIYPVIESMLDDLGMLNKANQKKFKKGIKDLDTFLTDLHKLRQENAANSQNNQ